MKVIVAGGRDFDNFELLELTLDEIHTNSPAAPITEVVCGEARGADTLGRRWAEKNNIPIASFPAKWKEYGRAAGPIRNTEMARYADGVIAFWDGKSRGTRHMIETMKKLGKKNAVSDYDGNLVDWEL